MLLLFSAYLPYFPLISEKAMSIRVCIIQHLTRLNIQKTVTPKTLSHCQNQVLNETTVPGQVGQLKEDVDFHGCHLAKPLSCHNELHIYRYAEV